ncbi:phosphotransferase family protein [Corynebacterium uterequi]|uniref:Phosphotransferase family protein n=1 Tax=Corynebacterium uterequi TaxID=1072256 RepID=A0A0G3HD51_9CORY|nr:phosphotransferase [Corynebacterium uterequi]AKK11214.1 phosphotransferase family protein [Corynebacterium uterequi]
MPSSSEIIAKAERLLRHRFGGVQRLSEPERLSGSGSAEVFRIRVANQPLFPHRSVILKYVPETGDILDDATLCREVAAYQFTTSLAPQHQPGPTLLAHDITDRLIVLTDVGDGDTLASLLSRPDPTARRQIVRDLGVALGRMHAATAGREEHFRVLLSRMLTAHPEAEAAYDLRDRSLVPAIDLGTDILQRSGVAVPAAVHTLADRAVRKLSSTRARAFTPFDLSPDNIIATQRVKFLDYKWADFRDVTFDLACVIGGFPQYLGTQPLTDEETDVFLRSWVNEVRTVWPTATRADYLHSNILAALVGWACSSVALMHYGSLAGALTALDTAALDAGDDDQDAGEPSELLLPAADKEFSAEQRMMRLDLYETFSALARFAALGTEPGDGCVAEFARIVSARLAQDPEA